MTKSHSTLIVAAHVNHPKKHGKRNDENWNDGPARYASSTQRRPLKRGLHKSSARRPIESGDFKAPVLGTRKHKSQTRVPLASLDIGPGNGEAEVHSTKSSIHGSPPSSGAPQPLPCSTSAAEAPFHALDFDTDSDFSDEETKAPLIGTGSDLLACDMASKMKACANTLENRILELEGLARVFSRQVRRVSNDFRALEAEVEHVSEQFETMEDDYITVLNSLTEERETTASYIGKLRNAETEIWHIYQELPEAQGITGFSQAKSFEPIFDRYA